MIGGFFFLASIIAVFIVFTWFTKNDAIPEDQPTVGFLAMTPPNAEPKKGPRRWTREDAARR